MTYQIQKFVARIRMSESRGEKNIMVSLSDAKELASELTVLLLQNEELRRPVVQPEPTESVVMSGGSFKDV